MKAEILILGALHRGPLHPYAIKRRLTNAMVECFTDVDVGTLYYAIRQLSQSDFIQPTSQQKVSRGGIRTVYRITALGRSRFQELLRELWLAPGSVAETLYVPMLFLYLSDAQTVLNWLRDKIERQRAAASELSEVQKQLGPQLGTGGVFLLKHLRSQRRLDLRWLQQLEAEVGRRGIRDLTKLPESGPK